MFEAVKNASIICGKDRSSLIVGDQVFDLPNDVLVQFTKLDQLFSPDFVFKYDGFDSAHSFLNYETAKSLCIFLAKLDQDLLKNYTQDQLISMIYLADYLGLQNWLIMKPVLTKIKRRAFFARFCERVLSTESQKALLPIKLLQKLAANGFVKP